MEDHGCGREKPSARAFIDGRDQGRIADSTMAVTRAATPNGKRYPAHPVAIARDYAVPHSGVVRGRRLSDLPLAGWPGGQDAGLG
ncbi:MAG TPA: hypothetical protein DCY82_09285, partial [Acidimicrobiaceae bacterium]|nr:hypothetical protein [Acidimicrobiaceae bacterium]